METWKDVAGYEGLYKVSDLGNVTTLTPSNRTKAGATRRPQTVGAGYYQINLTKNGVCSYHYIHRLVAIAFVDNPDRKERVNHKNGVKTDNRAENLEWCTQQENIKHARDTGLKKKSKLVNHVDKIRELRSAGATLKQLSETYGVSDAYMSLVCRYKRVI